MSYFNCERRKESFHPMPELPQDFYHKDGTCSYCGSLSQEEFFSRLEKGTFEITPTDKNYKAYLIGGGAHLKFYFQHLNDEGRNQFIQMYNEKRMKIGYPGYFYNKPYFAEAVSEPPGSKT